MHHGDNPQRFFLGGVGNQVFTYKNEPQRARREVRAPVALMGKRHESAKGVKDFGDDPVGCVRVFLGKVIANIVEVGLSSSSLVTCHSSLFFVSAALQS